MYESFVPVYYRVHAGVFEWSGRFGRISEEERSVPRNTQDRTIRQIVGHMIDSVSNNIHRIVHLHYRESPMEFPNYATQGNNDRWIAIQNYEQEDWELMIQTWKYLHLHFLHLMGQVDESKLEKQWISGPGQTVTLEEMIIDFLRHFELHIHEIEALLEQDDVLDQTTAQL